MVDNMPTVHGRHGHTSADQLEPEFGSDAVVWGAQKCALHVLPAITVMLLTAPLHSLTLDTGKPKFMEWDPIPEAQLGPLAALQQVYTLSASASLSTHVCFQSSLITCYAAPLHFRSAHGPDAGQRG